MSLPDRDELQGQAIIWLHHLGFRGELGETMSEQIVDFLVAYEPLTMPPVPRKLTEEEKADARAIFEGREDGRSACYFCAGLHAQVAGLRPEQQPCPRVKKIKRHADGITVLGIEHWPAGEWEADVVFPLDAYEEDEEGE